MKQVFGTAAVPLSPAVRAGDFVFISGQVPVDASGSVVAGGIEGQTKQVLDNIKAALALAGCGLEDVVKTTVVLADAGDFAAFNKVYAGYFPKDPPARTTVEAQLMIDIGIEIEAVAYKPLWRHPPPRAMALRIFTASLATETNTFSPIPTDRASFEMAFYAPPGRHPDTPTLCSAPIVVLRRRAKEEGFALIEGTATWAEPGGTVQRAAYEGLRDEILGELSAALPVEAVVLGLHGAMVAQGYDDCEGDLLPASARSSARTW